MLQCEFLFQPAPHWHILFPTWRSSLSWGQYTILCYYSNKGLLHSSSSSENKAASSIQMSKLYMSFIIFGRSQHEARSHSLRLRWLMLLRLSLWYGDGAIVHLLVELLLDKYCSWPDYQTDLHTAEGIYRRRHFKEAANVIRDPHYPGHVLIS